MDSSRLFTPVQKREFFRLYGPRALASDEAVDVWFDRAIQSSEIREMAYGATEAGAVLQSWMQNATPDLSEVFDSTVEARIVARIEGSRA
jgi:hypothetical protein